MTEKLDQDTKDALKEQGGITDTEENSTEDNTESAQEGLPNIELSSDKTKETSDQNSEEDSDLNKAVSKTLEEAGYNEKDLIERLSKDGGISDTFVEELKQKIDPVLVDAHVGRLRAELELAKVKESGKLDAAKAKEQEIKDMNNYIFDSVGGKDKFQVLGKTLKGELSQSELDIINTKLLSGNKDVVKEGLETAIKKYNNIRGMGGKLMSGDAGNSTDPEVHITKEEYMQLMRTEKYKTDPKYAAKIDADRLKTRKNDSERYGHGMYYGYHPDKGRYAL